MPVGRRIALGEIRRLAAKQPDTITKSEPEPISGNIDYIDLSRNRCLMPNGNMT